MREHGFHVAGGAVAAEAVSVSEWSTEHHSLHLAGGWPPAEAVLAFWTDGTRRPWSRAIAAVR